MDLTDERAMDTVNAERTLRGISDTPDVTAIFASSEGTKIEMSLDLAAVRKRLRDLQDDSNQGNLSAANNADYRVLDPIRWSLCVKSNLFASEKVGGLVFLGSAAMSSSAETRILGGEPYYGTPRRGFTREAPAYPRHLQATFDYTPKSPDSVDR
jgi:hypothetical protein